MNFNLVAGALVRLQVYDLSGRLVRTMASVYLPPGSQDLSWDGLGDDGVRQPSGMYSIRVWGHGVEIAQTVTRLN